MTQHISAADTLAAIGNPFISINGPAAGFDARFMVEGGATLDANGNATASAKLDPGSLKKLEAAAGLAPKGPAPKTTNAMPAPGRDLTAKADAQYTNAMGKQRGPLRYQVLRDPKLVTQMQLRKGPQARMQMRHMFKLRRTLELAKAQGPKPVAFQVKPARLPRSLMRQKLADELAKGTHLSLLTSLVAAAKEVGINVMEEFNHFNKMAPMGPVNRNASVLKVKTDAVPDAPKPANSRPKKKYAMAGPRI